MSNFLTRFLDRLAQPPDLGPALGVRSLGSSLPPHTIGRPTWPTQNIETFRDQGYNSAPVVYACINLRARSVSAATLRVYRGRSGGQRTEVEDHPLRQLMQQPNAAMSEAEFLLLTVLFMDAAGFAVIEKERARAGNVIGLWHLRPDWIRPIPREQAAPDWEYRVPGREPVIVKSENVIAIQAGPSLTMGYTGLSPISVALREIGIENASTDFLKLFMERGGVPMYALTMEREITDETTALLYKERWAQAYGSFRNWANIALLHGGMDVKQIGMNLDDMAYPELRRLTEAHIAMTFGVPPILIGSQVGLERSTYSNYLESRRTFYEDTITPLWARIDGALSRGLLPEFESAPDVSIEFDASNIPALQKDENAVWERTTSAVTAGFVMVDEARAEIGLPPLPKKAGQVFLLPFSVTPTRPEDLVMLAEDAAKPPEPVPPALVAGGEGEEEEEPEPVADDDQDSERFALGRRQVWVRRHQRLDVRGLRFLPTQKRASLVSTNKQAIARLGRTGAPKLAAFWREQGKRITEAATRTAWIGISYPRKDIPIELANEVHSHRPVTGFWDNANPGEESRDIAEIDWAEEEEALARVLKAQHSLAGVTSFRNVSKELGIELDWDLANPNVRRVLKELATRIRGINQTTQEDVRRVVGEALDEGVTMEQLSERLTGLFEETYKGRSMAVARTESQVAYNRAHILGYQESNVVAATELADNPEHDTDPGSDGLTCAERNGLVVPLDQAQVHISAEHVNGSLCCIPVLSKNLGEV